MHLTFLGLDLSPSQAAPQTLRIALHLDTSFAVVVIDANITTTSCLQMRPNKIASFPRQVQHCIQIECIHNIQCWSIGMSARHCVVNPNRELATLQHTCWASAVLPCMWPPLSTQFHYRYLLSASVTGFIVLQADIVFLSPPWGGPAYSKSGLFDVSQNIGSLGKTLCELLDSASAALRQPERSNIACFLPRNTDLLALSDTVQLEQCVVERNVLNGHLKAVTAYYGDLANS